MKDHLNFYRIIVLCSWMILIVPLLYCVFHSVSTIRYVTFCFDPQLSHSACDAIEHQVTLFTANGVYNPWAIVEKVSHANGAIKSIELQQFPQHHAVVTIKAFDPIIRINHDQVLLENQAIIASDYYATYAIESLQKIAIAQPLPSQLSPAVMTAMKQCITQKVFDHYTVYLANEHEWYLHDMKDPLFTLCCNSSSLPLDTLRVAYNRLKNRIKKKGITKTKWITDLRFQDQIILSMNKGGRYG